MPLTIPCVFSLSYPRDVAILEQSSLFCCNCKVGDIGDVGLIPGSGRSPWRRNSNPPQYSCLVNPMDRGAWQATVHGITKSQTQLGKAHSLLCGRTII